MAGRVDQREAIAAALKAFERQQLADVAQKFFGSLGYKSDRRIPIGTSRQFQEQLDPHGRLTAGECEALDQLRSFHLLFQLTDAELDLHRDMFDDAKAVQETKIESYLFFAAELPPGQYPRSTLSTLVRAINKPLPMPALVLFRHGGTVSLGIIHRRLHKRDQARDVLDKVTLIKDISCGDPIRAHLEILNDFVLPNLDVDFGVSSFVGLHEAWQKRLSSYALSNEFYREIADWYFWAHHQVDDGVIQLPQHCDTEEEKSLFLIRLLTRVIFSWFLVEKRLIPTDLFREHRLKMLLKEFNPSKDPKKPDHASTYYHAILQNLFFGTLNMPSEQRGFREKKKAGERYDKSYGITNLWRYETDFRAPAEWLSLAGRVPFLNGGLFDCLDDKTGKKDDNFILDGFSDNPKLACHLPNDLFFGPERTADLSRDYGEEDKRSARSKRAKVRGLIEILSRYKFTIEENTPLEEEIALDPELLGKVFENLLASYNEDTATTARKALGAYYTPREIVSYMVDEALKSYLGSQVPRCKSALQDLFSNKATLKEINSGTREALIAAIGRVKILDPACGSGAFPMGALHRLVDLLQKLDPNNESWKRDRLAEARRYRQLLEDSGGAKEEIAACDARIGDIEKSFDSRFHALDFARKLYLIENAIYGVDILPIATQIAKLRFFISLIVDQNVDQKGPNLGVRPLPNLETRLVAADILIPIDKEETNLFTGEIDKLRADLAKIRHEHFNARSPSRKRKWREADESKRKEIAKLLEDSHFLTHDTAKKLAAWDPYDQNSHAPFFDSEWMFGFPVGKVTVDRNAPVTLLGNLALVNEAGGQTELTGSMSKEIDSGFDVVIGNPPYVRIQTLKKKDPNLVSFFKDYYASAAKGNYDLYVVFIEAGLKLLNSNGHLAYICPHKFFNSEYGEPLRKLIAGGKHLRHVVHFGDEQVFPGATIYTCLLFLGKHASPEFRFVRAHDLEAWKSRLAGVEGVFPAAAITQAEWNFSVGSEGRIVSFLDRSQRRLKDISLRIFQGIIPGADRVYALRRISKDGPISLCWSRELDAEVKIESALLKPLVSGSHVEPYTLRLDSAVVIYPYDEDGDLIPPGTLKANYPKAYQYFVSTRSALNARDGGSASGPEWYRYIRSQNIALQLSPKIAVPRLVNRLKAASDFDGTVCFDNVDVGGIIVDETSGVSRLTVLGLLNSSVLNFYFLHIAAPYRGGYFSANRQFIEPLPIRAPHGSEQVIFDSQVVRCQQLRRLLASQSTGQSTRDPLMLAYWERMVNAMVYELYFPEEVNGAGLRIFYLIQQAGLDDDKSMPKSNNVAYFRRLFETIYDGAHPLRIALDKLQTMDTVRIIEGKT